MSEAVKNYKLILLTGAGFTYNFGGFLGREMWAKIFNNPAVQKSEKFRALLLDNFDFEGVYFKVMSESAYSPEEKAIMRDAVESAYDDLDREVRTWNQNDDNPTSINMYANGGLGSLMRLFHETSGEKSYFFTLNQDLFIERWWGHQSLGAPSFPSYLRDLKGSTLKREDFVSLPNSNNMESIRFKLNDTRGMSYVKLHGSYAWKSYNGDSRMVLGKNKIEDINSEPILRWYWGLFQDAIKGGDKKILIIGYGFGDEHVNNLLLEGVKNCGLRIYIISPESPQKLKSRLEGRPRQEGILWEEKETKRIWNGVSGYFPYTLRQIFPPNQQTTALFKEIERALIA